MKAELKIKSKMLKTAALCGTVFATLLAGCGRGTQTVKNIEGIENYALQITDITIPDEVKIIGLGEATHGNRELQTLKKEVFEVLIEKNLCHVFALEADFGGAVRVNEYIHGGDGTAEEAVCELGFGLHRTDEMADFVEWLRTYNETATESAQVSFYGFDMQRYDNNKEILFDYLSKVDLESEQKLEEALQALTDETVYSQTKEVNTKAAEDMAAFLSDMEEKREEYIAQSDEKSYKIAYACGECILQNATIQSGSVSYSKARDQYMADKVTTILDIEKTERLMISGHNGHIQKKSSNPTFTCMGELLAGQYKETYFTIGTDFIQGEVNVIDETGNEANVEIESHNVLKDQIQKLEGNIFYFDIAKASENTELAEIMNQPIRIISIGNDLSSMQRSMESFYTSKDVPAENYNGLILFKTVTPTERKPAK